uniref:Uncharacterized protein n=2 Tax=viral metagenome TaxID=1070528 RepID=A0A6M3L6Q9_9ZZZZ
MAVQRLNLKQIEDAILQIMGFDSSENAPWKTSATLYQRINEYGQRLPMRLNQIARETNVPTPVHFDMWKSSCNSSTTGTTVVLVAASSATIYFPTDYDHTISLYDITNKRPIQLIDNVDKWHYERLVHGPAGPPRYVEIGGFASDGAAAWRRTATLYPATESGVTPSVRLKYWRIPAAMTATVAAQAQSQYPDVDPKYESLFIYGPVIDLARIDLARQQNLGFEQWVRLERELLVEMLSTCRSI